MSPMIEGSSAIRKTWAASAYATSPTALDDGDLDAQGEDARLRRPR